jgi:hypothetical protein
VRVRAFHLRNQFIRKVRMRDWTKIYGVYLLYCTKVKININKDCISIIIIFPIVLYGCETCSLTLGEESRLRVFENRVLRRVFGRKRDEVAGNGENYIMRSLVIFTRYPLLCGW